MTIWSDVTGAIGTGTGQSLWLFVLVIVGIIAGVLLLGVAAWWWFIKKKWNIKAEIKLTRSGGRLTNAEWGKASFNAKRGVCFLKRPGLYNRPVSVRIFDIREYIQGDNIVTFIQVAADDYRPVLNKSWEEYESDIPRKNKKTNEIIRDEHGNITYEKASMMNIRVDTGLNKAWNAAWKQAAKQAYSLKSFFTQFQTPIAIAIVIIAVFVGFAIMWTRLGSIC